MLHPHHVFFWQEVQGRVTNAKCVPAGCESASYTSPFLQHPEAGSEQLHCTSACSFPKGPTRPCTLQCIAAQLPGHPATLWRHCKYPC